MISRRTITTGFAATTATLLSSCGTIIYPDRVNQKERGDLDIIVVGMDAVGLLFFLVPGIIAFAVDFGTGAIYFPEDHKKGKRETTIFDKVDSQVKLNQKEIERIVSDRAGQPIDLNSGTVQVTRIENLNQFGITYDRLTSENIFASL